MRRASQDSGFTVLEALFSLLIFSIVLSALVYSLAQLSRVSVSRKDFGAELEALQLASLMRADALNSSSSSFSGTTATFVGQDRSLSLQERLDLGITTSRVESTTEYEYREGWLYRRQSSSSGSSQTSPLNRLENVEFEQRTGYALARFSFQKLRRLESFEIRIPLP